MVPRLRVGTVLWFRVVTTRSGLVRRCDRSIVWDLMSPIAYDWGVGVKSGVL